MKLELNVYDKSGDIVKTARAQAADLEFGTVRSLMELLNVDSIEDTGHLLKTIYGAWEQIIRILNKCFPDMEHGDWEHVKLKELIPVILDILRYSFSEILTIPKDPKN